MVDRSLRMYSHAKRPTKLMVHRSDLWLTIYVQLKFVQKCGSWRLSDFRSASKKTKWSSIIAIHWLLQACMGKDDMGTIPIVSRWIFGRVDPPMQELHSRKLSKTLVYEINAQCSHRVMKTQWRGPPICNNILSNQQSQGFIDSTSGCRFMLS